MFSSQMRCGNLTRLYFATRRHCNKLLHIYFLNLKETELQNIKGMLSSKSKGLQEVQLKCDAYTYRRTGLEVTVGSSSTKDNKQQQT